MNLKEKIIKSQYILYDQDVISHIEEPLFNPALLQKHNVISGQAQGRGTTYFFEKEGHQLVLRHYRRGGYIAKLSPDKYFWTGYQQTRAWQEWHLLAKMRDLGLPVPHPVAARVMRHGFLYTADIVTGLINNAKPLGEIITQSPLRNSDWENIGKCIRRFHDNNVYHADLNANNILITSTEVFLADFDKCEIKISNEVWKNNNLSRLNRSLKKLQSIHSTFHFDERDWAALTSAYTDLSM